MHHPSRAFSLIELSIVLVILGLLSGGILSGQSLIRAAEIRSVATEFQRYTTATMTFRDKYFMLPGDMTNATAFWGKDNTNCAANTGTTATPGTCNGNGDGMIDPPAAGGTPGEAFALWQHLALAGLIEGTYSGLAGPTARFDSTAGVNVPKSKLNGGDWQFRWLGVYAGDGQAFAMDYGNELMFSKITASTVNPILKPEEAWNIDTKLDDGKPGSGKLVARFWNNACSAADTGTSTQTNLVASYRLNDTSIQCGLMFRGL